MGTDQPSQGAPTPARPKVALPARTKPDPRPTRLIIGAGAFAAITVIGAGLGRYPAAAEGGAPTAGGSVAVAGASNTWIASASEGHRPVRYVYLKPGQEAPPGAKVISRIAPVRRTVTRTRQSGG